VVSDQEIIMQQKPLDFLKVSGTLIQMVIPTNEKKEKPEGNI